MTPRDTALRTIDRLWASATRIMAAQQAVGADWTAMVPFFGEVEIEARSGREALEDAADAGEPEPLRQARIIFKMLEASSSVCLYTWVGGDRGYAKDADPWAKLGGETMGLLPKLKSFVESLPE